MNDNDELGSELKDGGMYQEPTEFLLFFIPTEIYLTWVLIIEFLKKLEKK